MICDDLSCRFHIVMDTSKIVYLNCILDSYEGLGMMRTADENLGEIIIYTTSFHEKEMVGLLNALKNEGVNLDIKKIDYIDQVS